MLHRKKQTLRVLCPLSMPVIWLGRPVTNVSSALAGLSSGVFVRQGSGKPGSDGATIRIRGVGTLSNSDPLVVIDGIIGTMDAVNPDDIQSMSVLKDAASASIYGSQSANGVILITTKKGNRIKQLSLTMALHQQHHLLTGLTLLPTMQDKCN